MLSKVMDSGSPNGFLVFGLGLLAILSIGALWGAFRVMRVTRIVENVATSKIRSAAQGHVEIVGTTHWLPGTTILSPLTQTECVWWSYEIRQRVRDSQGRTAWQIVDQRNHHEPFLLVDDTGQCVVNPRGAELLGSDLKAGGDRREWYGMTAMPAAGSASRMGGSASSAESTYKYQERVIRRGAPLHVLGDFRTRHTTRDRSSNESLAEATHTLSKPKQSDKPFILSTRSQRELSDGSRGLAGFLFACFLFGGALLVWAVLGLWQGKSAHQIAYGFGSAFSLILFIALSVSPLASGLRMLFGMPTASSGQPPARRSRWLAIPVLVFALLMGALTGFVCYSTALEAGLISASP